MKFLVKYLDGTSEEVTVTHADRIVAEQQGYRRGWASASEMPQSIITLQCHLAFKRSRATGLTDHEVAEHFDDWLAKIDDIDIVSDVESGFTNEGR